MFSPVPGMTLLFPSGPANDLRRLHLFVLMTSPSGPARQVLMVPITSCHEKSDTTCRVPGQGAAHQFVTHDSVVEYRHARIERVDVLARGVGSGEFVEKPPVDKALLSQVRAGFFTSRFAKPFTCEFLKAHG